MADQLYDQPRRLPHVARPSRLNVRSLIGMLVVFIVGWSLVQAGVFSRPIVNGGGWPLLWRFVQAVGRPDLSSTILLLTVQSTLITLAYAVCGTALSLIIGCVGGVLGSEVWWRALQQGRPRRWSVALPWLAVRALLAIPRAIHEVIWGLFFVNILGLDPLVAVLAIAIPFGAITAKVFAEILDETPRQVLHALQASGTSPLSAFAYSVVPQALPDLIAYTFYRFECAIRAATILGIVGAGGLGYQILLSLQALRYEQLWTFLFALIVLSGLSDLWSSAIRQQLRRPSRDDIVLDHGVQCSKAPAGSSSFIRMSLLLLIPLIVWAWWYIAADVSKLWAPRTARLFAGVITDSFPPRLNGTLLGELLRLSAQTLSMSILAISFAGVGALLLSLPAARNFSLPGGLFIPAVKNGVVTAVSGLLFVVSRGLLLLTRAIAEPLWAFIVLLVLFPGILPGALGLGLYNLGILGRLMADVTENVDERPLRALRAQGASGTQVLFYGLLPSTLPRKMAYLLYRWEVCIRATVVVGLVGAGGLGRLLTEQLASFDYPGVVTTLLCLLGLTLLVDLLSAGLRKLLR